MDNENDVAELLSLCGVWKTYHFESPMLHWIIKEERCKLNALLFLYIIWLTMD